MLNLLVIVPALLGGVAETATPASDSTAAQQFDIRPRLMSPERDAMYRQFFPQVENSELRDLLADPRLLIYTEAEMPKAYQFFDGAFPGVHSVNYNVSANHSEPFGNGNREFPWSHPAGTHRSSNVSSFRFLRLPRDSQGVFWPVVWYSHQGSQGGYAAFVPAKSATGTWTCFARFRPRLIWHSA